MLDLRSSCFCNLSWRRLISAFNSEISSKQVTGSKVGLTIGVLSDYSFYLLKLALDFVCVNVGLVLAVPFLCQVLEALTNQFSELLLRRVPKHLQLITDLSLELGKRLLHLPNLNLVSHHRTRLLLITSQALLNADDLVHHIALHQLHLPLTFLSLLADHFLDQISSLVNFSPALLLHFKQLLTEVIYFFLLLQAF